MTEFFVYHSVFAVSHYLRNRLIDSVHGCRCYDITNVFVSDIAIFVLKRDVKLQLTN